MREFKAFIIGLGLCIPIMFIVQFLYMLAIPDGDIVIDWIIRILAFLIGFASYHLGLKIGNNS